MHDVVFMIAKSDTEVSQKIREKWQGKSVHGDKTNQWISKTSLN